MSALRRTRAGLFTEADAHTMEEILAAKQAGPDALQALLLPVERVFDPLPLLTVEERTAAHLYNGCPTSHYPRPRRALPRAGRGGALPGPGQDHRRGASGGKTVR